MRETTIHGVDDDFKYSFGCDVGILCAAIDTARRVGYADEECDVLTHICIIDGKTLISFICTNAPEHQKIIEKIKEENRYKLIAWDW